MNIARAAAAGLLLAAACSSSAGSDPQIHFVVPPDNPSAAYVEVTGLSGAALEALGRASLEPDAWARLLRVAVKSGAVSSPEQTPVAGRYAVENRALRFTPVFPFDAGREYEVTFDPGRLPVPSGGAARPVSTVVSRPATGAVPSTTVTHVFPSTDVLPENQLRMYIHFSAPMGLRGGMDHIALLDEKGQTVEDPFLPLDADFWNADRTRYTVFFDPGRVKRGILPNRSMGPSLRQDRTYTFVVRRDWTDANGQPLREGFTRRFRVGPPDLRPLDQRAWKLDVPAPGTRDALVVRFPEPLDHGLLLRTLGVQRGAAVVAGEVRVESGETRWTFTPGEPWQPGAYELVALTVLEDLAGNRIGRAFEVDRFERSDASADAETVAIPFHVAGRRE